MEKRGRGRPKIKPVMTEGLKDLLDKIIPAHSAGMKQSELRGICLSHGYVIPSIKDRSDEHLEFWADWARWYSPFYKCWDGDDDNRDEFLKD